MNSSNSVSIRSAWTAVKPTTLATVGSFHHRAGTVVVERELSGGSGPGAPDAFCPDGEAIQRTTRKSAERAVVRGIYCLNGPNQPVADFSVAISPRLHQSRHRVGGTVRPGATVEEDAVRSKPRIGAEAAARKDGMIVAVRTSVIPVRLTS